MIVSFVEAAIAWIGSLVSDERRRALSHEEMTARLIAIINDPLASATEKHAARLRLDILTNRRAEENLRACDREARRERRAAPMSAESRRMMVWAFAGLIWLGFCVLQYHAATSRMEECRDAVLDWSQRSMCIRHAIESRDFVLVWGVGPFVILAFAYAFQVTRSQRDR